MRFVKLLVAPSLVGFGFALTLHIATFFSSNIGGMQRFFVVHLIAMGIAIATIAIYKFRGEPFEAKSLPAWAKAPLIFLFLYFVLNMVSMLVVFKGGSPEMVNGTYELADHGKLIRYLTLSEYQSLRNWELRFFSSGWISSLQAYLHTCGI